MFKFSLGDKVRCIITGFEGVITGRAEYFNGCVTYCVKPPITKDGAMQDGQWIDQPQLKLVKGSAAAPIHDTPLRAVGGPRMDQAPER